MKFTAARYNIDYYYIWIIHGNENCYEELIAHLHSVSAAVIVSYIWIEDLKLGSNRIEYLFDHMIPRVLTKKEKWRKVESFRCVWNNCGKLCISQKQLNRHQREIHFQPVQELNQTDEEESVADGCAELFASKKQSSQHQNQPTAIQEVQEPNEQSSEESQPFISKVRKQFQCDHIYCTESFSSNKELKRHRSTANHSTNRQTISQEHLMTATVDQQVEQEKEPVGSRQFEKMNYQPNDSVTEGFATPFDHYFDEYCSPFPDLEIPFGSKGCFFSVSNWTTKVVYVNPPFDETLMTCAFNRIYEQIRNDETRRKYIFTLPDWKDFTALNTLKQCIWINEIKTYRKGQLYFISYYGDCIKEISPCDIAEITLMND
ncbi:unnamed protein product [Didymodactylos carnosus]|uniref:C2H2-type domain-containing protein n=1 Tax=Didymodactylos carnosus TaxID=1234261 RepID=A0A814GEA2_9BILA|nr:unnamed protein product [Didymodactylos carnosus]CAF3766877.1 unnamed protein product [Didymodactylos carnosus]